MDRTTPLSTTPTNIAPKIENVAQTVHKVVDTAIGIEGLKRQWGVHAAGVIMSSEPLLDIIPMLKRPADGAAR